MEPDETTQPTDDDYAPSPVGWVRDQVAEIEARGDTAGTTVADRPVVVLTMRGAKTGKLRKVPLMRVEHEGRYAAVASKGGAPAHPTWYANLTADPDITLQDGRETRPFRARQLSGDERAQWWERAVEAYPPYAEYQTKTDREIPVFVLEPR